jgi:maltose-binding protein MalE
MKKNFLRLLSLIMALCMIVGLFTACGDTSKTSDPTTDDGDVQTMDDVDADPGLNLGGDTSGSSSGNGIDGITNVDNNDIFKNIPKKLQGTTVTIAHWGDEGASEYQKVQKQFTKDTKIKVNDKVWDKISLEGLKISAVEQKKEEDKKEDTTKESTDKTE